MLIDNNTKEYIFEKFVEVDDLFPILEKNDPDFCAAYLHTMLRFVEKYGARHGVIPPSRRTGMLLSEHDIKDVIFNNPATVIIWADGSKTVVKCQEDDCEHMTPESGIAIAIMKKVFGNKGNYNNALRRLVERASNR